jgi:hypothetical protein
MLGESATRPFLIGLNFLLYLGRCLIPRLE